MNFGRGRNQVDDDDPAEMDYYQGEDDYGSNSTQPFGTSNNTQPFGTEYLDDDDDDELIPQMNVNRQEKPAPSEDIRQEKDLKKQLQAMMTEREKLKSRCEMATNEVEELKKAVASDREELVELQLGCEEQKRSIENEAVPDELKQRLSEMERMTGVLTGTRFNKLKEIIQSLREGGKVITKATERRKLFLSQHAMEVDKLIVHMNKQLEIDATKIRELQANKKAAEARYAAEIGDFNSDIRAMRNEIADIDKRMSEDRHRMKGVKDEMVETAAKLAESKLTLSGAKRTRDLLKNRLASSKNRRPEELEGRLNALKMWQEKLDSVNSVVQDFRSGQTNGHEQVKAYKTKIAECRVDKAIIKQKAMACQKESEKFLETQIAESKDLNKQLRDATDQFNFIRQKNYSDRLDFDYTLSKSELDSEKIASTRDDNLRDTTCVIRELKQQKEGLREIRRQRDELVDAVTDDDEKDLSDIIKSDDDDIIIF